MSSPGETTTTLPAVLRLGVAEAEARVAAAPTPPVGAAVALLRSAEASEAVVVTALSSSEAATAIAHTLFVRVGGADRWVAVDEALASLLAEHADRVRVTDLASHTAARIATSWLSESAAPDAPTTPSLASRQLPAQLKARGSASMRRQPAVLNLAQVRTGEASPAIVSPTRSAVTAAAATAAAAAAATAAAAVPSDDKSTRMRAVLDRFGDKARDFLTSSGGGTRVKEGWIQRDGQRRYLVLEDSGVLLWSKTPLGAALDSHDLNDWEVRRTTTDKGRIALELIAKSGGGGGGGGDDAPRRTLVLTGRDDVQTNEWLVACESVLLDREVLHADHDAHGVVSRHLRRRQSTEVRSGGPMSGWMRRNGRERWFALVGAHLYWFAAEQPTDLIVAAEMRYRRALSSGTSSSSVEADADAATSTTLPDSALAKRALGSLDMRTTELMPSTSAVNAFECRTAAGKRYTLAAATRSAVRRWVHALCEAQTPEAPPPSTGPALALSPSRAKASADSVRLGLLSTATSSSSSIVTAAAAAAAASDPMAALRVRVPVAVEGDAQAATAFVEGSELVLAFESADQPAVTRRMRLSDWLVDGAAPANTLKLVALDEQEAVTMTSATHGAQLAQLRATLAAFKDIQDVDGERLSIVVLAGSDAHRDAVFGATAAQKLRVCPNVPADGARVTAQLIDKLLLDTTNVVLGTTGRAPPAQRGPSLTGIKRIRLPTDVAATAAVAATSYSSADVRGALLVLDMRNVDAGVAAWDSLWQRFDVQRPRVPAVLLVGTDAPTEARTADVLRAARLRLSDASVFVLASTLFGAQLSDVTLREPLTELTRLVRAHEAPSRVFVLETTFETYGGPSSSFEIDCIVYNASDSLLPFAVQHGGDLDGDVAVTLPDGFIGSLKRGRNALSIVVLCNRPVTAEKRLQLICGGETTPLLVRFQPDVVASFYLSLLYQHYDYSAADRYVAVHRQLLELGPSRLASRRSQALAAAHVLSHSRKYRLPPAAHRAAASGVVDDVPALRLRRRDGGGDDWRTQLVVELSATFCGVTPLYVAAAFGQSQFVAEMLTLVGGERALHLAQNCTSDNDMRCQTVLHVAAVHAQGRVITAVLSALPLPPFIDATDGVPLGRCTALHCAAYRGPLGAGVVELLQGGADFRAQDLRGEPAINPSAWSRQDDLVVSLFLPAVCRAALLRPSVTLLNLANCELPALPDAFFRLEHLKVVDLSLNRIGELSASVSQLTNLVELYLGFNQLRELPERALLSLPLEVLDVKGNPLSVEARFVAIGAVRERRLELNGVELPQLPLERLAALTYLEELVVHACGLVELPAFGTRGAPMLPRLRVLALSSNALAQFDLSSVSPLAATLVELDLSDNQLTVLPSGLSRLSQLRRLSVASNRLSRMPNALPASCIDLNVAFNRAISLLPGDPLAVENDAISPRESLSPSPAAAAGAAAAAAAAVTTPPSTSRSLRRLNSGGNKSARRPTDAAVVAAAALQVTPPSSQRAPRPIAKPTYYGTWDPTALQTALDTVKQVSPAVAHAPVSAVDESFRDVDSDDDDDGGAAASALSKGGSSGSKRHHHRSLRRRRGHSTRVDIESFTQLQVLDISALSLRSPVDVFLVHLTSLRVLTMNETGISVWPESLTRLQALESLTMRGNRLREVPAAVQALTALEVLRLEHNSLELIASHIGALPRLRTVALDHNRLLRLPAAIGHLRGLFSLSVSSNPSLSWPPPPVVARGTRAMLEAAQRELTRPSTVRRVPLLLLGDFGAENAALRRALIVACNPALQELELDGIDAAARVDGVRTTSCTTTRDEKTYQFEITDGIDAAAWRYAHPLLLRPGAVCLVVFDARRPLAQARLAHWFSSITHAAPTAPILLVATHVDELQPAAGAARTSAGRDVDSSDSSGAANGWEHALDLVYQTAFDAHLVATPALKRVVCGVTTAAFGVRRRRESLALFGALTAVAGQPSGPAAALVGTGAAIAAGASDLTLAGGGGSAAAVAAAALAAGQSESTGIDWLIERCCIAVLESEAAGDIKLPPERVARLEKLLVGMATTRRTPLMRMAEFRGVAALCDVLGERDIAETLRMMHARGVITLLPQTEDIIVLRPTYLVGPYSVLLRRREALVGNAEVRRAWLAAGVPADAHAPLYAHLAHSDLVLGVPGTRLLRPIVATDSSDDDSAAGKDGGAEAATLHSSAGRSSADDEMAGTVATMAAEEGERWDDIAPASRELLHHERLVAHAVGLTRNWSTLLPGALDQLQHATDNKLPQRWWQPPPTAMMRVFEHRRSSGATAVSPWQLRGVLVVRLALAVRLRCLVPGGALFSRGSTRVRLDVRAAAEEGGGCDVELRAYGPDQASVMAPLLEVVRATHDDWFDVQPRERVPCTHCLASTRRQSTPYHFLVSELESIVVKCGAVQAPPMPTRLLTPDTARSSALESSSSASRITPSEDGRSSADPAAASEDRSADDSELRSANNSDDEAATVHSSGSGIGLGGGGGGASEPTSAQPVAYCRWSPSGERVAVPVAQLAPDVTMTYGPRIVTGANLVLGAALAAGAYGTVFVGSLVAEATPRGVHSSAELPVAPPSTAVAVKQLTPASFVGQPQTASFAALRREVCTLYQLAACDRIVQLRALSIRPLALVTELLPAGDLLAVIARRRGDGDRPFSLGFVVSVAGDVAKALAFMHNATPPLIHRDVKSPNVLLLNVGEGRADARLADLGSARIGMRFKRSDVDQIRWLAPEVMRHEIYDAKSDIYSFGVVLSELLTRRRPFDDRGQQWEYQLQDDIIGGARPALPDDANAELVQLARSCWADSPLERFSARHLSAQLEKMRSALPPADDAASAAPAAAAVPDAAASMQQARLSTLSSPRSRRATRSSSSRRGQRFGRSQSMAMRMGDTAAEEMDSASDDDVPAVSLAVSSGPRTADDAFVRASRLLSAIERTELQRQLAAAAAAAAAEQKEQ